MLFSSGNYFTESILDFEPLPNKFGAILLALALGNLVSSYVVKYLSICVYGH
jgi:hypothetical protein